MNKKPHVLILSSWYPTLEKPFLGNFVQKHAELIAQHYQVTVLSIQANSSVNQITVSEKTTLTFRELTVYYPQTKNPILKLLRQQKAFKFGVRQISSVDLIHGNVILPKGLQFIWAKNHFQKPLVVTEHASYYSVEKRQKWSFIDRYILKKVSSKTDIFTAVSPFLAEEISIHFHGQNIRIIPNVIDADIFTFKEKSTSEKVKFLHVSTLDSRYKNPLGILQSCEQLIQKGYSNFSLEIVSDEDYSFFQKYVAEKEMSSFVYFSGPCSPEEIAFKLHESNAFVLFSTYETFSCVIAESLATGTPVITTPVGIGKRISPEIGILVNPNDTDNLSEAMIQIIEKKCLFDSRKMRAFSEEFFAPTVLKTIDSIYSEVLNQK